ncbi:hypothetical protein CONLIGDRAFT_700143 [Coniochaeta ligniaria NRRL 30616]|uniref:Uncharacterized protein n=1 Tax=Coniochaeta ligniaria NRRL 30616 TaxID=1408157 RepID=A0A1J7JMS0_9PEZI|nr:hypothetical protein CONLIGDRAFT_700143 [Coniochaeta ligniaria NRRL 30616]
MVRATRRPSEASPSGTRGKAIHGPKPDSESKYRPSSSKSGHDVEDAMGIPGVSVVDFAPGSMLRLPSIIVTAEPEPGTEAATPSSIFEPVPDQDVLFSSLAVPGFDRKASIEVADPKRHASELYIGGQEPIDVHSELDIATPAAVPSEDAVPLPDILINAPPEDDLPAYRVDLKPRQQRTGQSVLLHPPEDSMLPSIRWRHLEPIDDEDYIPEFPEPLTDPWRPPEAPPKPTKPLGTYFWPPPNGDPRHRDSFLALAFPRNSKGKTQGTLRHFWFYPVTKELPSIGSVLEDGQIWPPRRKHVSWLLKAMGVPVPHDEGDSEGPDYAAEVDESLSELLCERLSDFLARQPSRRSFSNDSPVNSSTGGSTKQSTSSSQQSVAEDEAFNEPISTDGAGFGEPRPGLSRSEAGPSASNTKLGKAPHHVQRPKSSSDPLPPSNIGASSAAATSQAPTRSRRASTTALGGTSQTRPPISNIEPGQKAGRPPRRTHRPRAFHQLIHSGRKKHWKAPIPTDPPGPEDLDLPYQHKFLIDANVLLPSVREIFVDKPEEKKPPPPLRRYSVAPDNDSADIGPDDKSGEGGAKLSAKDKGKGVDRSTQGGGGSPKSGRATELDALESTGAEEGDAKGKKKRKKKRAPTVKLPPAFTVPPPGDESHKPKKKKLNLAEFEDKEEDDNYRPRGATISLEPIVENQPLRFPRNVPRADIDPKEEEKFDPDDPLFTWYFPRKSPDYWEMLDDVAKMFEDLQIQDMTLKHFQRPIDYVTVLLCLSNVVFAEMFETLQEKVTDGQYRIEFVTNGRTGVNLYLSAYSREHTYIAKSWMHKVNMQVDIAKQESPRSVLQYISLIECVERGLVHDKFKSWGRIPDAQFNTWTDIDSPTVIHEVGIAESRQELYRRCKRYLVDIPNVNVVIAIKVDSSECDWAELLLLARDPGDDQICLLHNWVRIWGHGAVNTGSLMYYPSDFLEIEDRWKIPVIHMRPLRILDGPRTPIVKITFGELGRMVSLAKWENQALMGYVAKPLPWPAGYGNLKAIERLSVLGEERKPPPDFARTLAVAAAVGDHTWVEPFVADEWREEAKRELDEWTENPEIVAGESPEEISEPEEESSSESETDSSDEDEEEGPPIWPPGVTGLI